MSHIWPRSNFFPRLLGMPKPTFCVDFQALLSVLALVLLFPWHKFIEKLKIFFVLCISRFIYVLPSCLMVTINQTKWMKLSPSNWPKNCTDHQWKTVMRTNTGMVVAFVATSQWKKPIVCWFIWTNIGLLWIPNLLQKKIVWNWPGPILKVGSRLAMIVPKKWKALYLTQINNQFGGASGQRTF